MILVSSVNGHVQIEPGRKVIAAGAEGAFFVVTHGPREDAPELEQLKVYYTADYGRELFRVVRVREERPRRKRAIVALKAIKGFLIAFVRGIPNLF